MRQWALLRTPVARNLSDSLGTTRSLNFKFRFAGSHP